VQLLILDIDQTLTDSIGLHHDCFLQAFDQFEIPNIDTDWGGYTHHTDSWIFEEVFRRAFDRPPLAHEINQFNDRHIACFEEGIQAEPIREIVGAREFIRAVQANSQTAYAFATGSIRPLALRKLESLGISYPPELLITASEFLTREDIVRQAIANARKYWGMTDFDRVISIGDGYWDLLTARNLDLEFIGIATGEKADRLRNAGAENVFPDLAARGITNLIDDFL
jgi:phosphoglycolate phosphatase-like HAD superfamily hydrolase